MKPEYQNTQVFFCSLKIKINNAPVAEWLKAVDCKPTSKDTEVRIFSGAHKKNVMELIDKLTDELIYLRSLAREEKNYMESDLIRNILDSRGVFVFDTKDDQIVYHLGDGYTRQEVIKNIKHIDSMFR